MALRVGHEKLTAETGWMPQVSWEDGVLQTIRWYAEHRDKLDRPCGLAGHRLTEPVSSAEGNLRRDSRLHARLRDGSTGHP